MTSKLRGAAPREASLNRVGRRRDSLPSLRRNCAKRCWTAKALPPESMAGRLGKHLGFLRTCFKFSPIFAIAVNKRAGCQRFGKSPRQVHLSKGKEPEPDGSLLTSSLRPVSISCLFWRVYTKARFKNTVVQNWIEAVFPSCVYGGIPKKGVQDAAGQLLRCAHAGKYIGSLDLSSVFDLAEPRLAIRIMQHMGLDRRLTSLLQEVWGDQTRFLQFLGETYPQGVAVQHSLPQGDSFSMTAMACVILPAVLDIARQCSDTVQIVYADDRSFACDSAHELKRVKTLWQQWAQILGLKENEDKAQYYHLQTKGRRKLVSVGLDPTKIRGSIKVLGYVFSGVLARKADAHETRRLDEARQRASKCRVSARHAQEENSDCAADRCP